VEYLSCEGLSTKKASNAEGMNRRDAEAAEESFSPRSLRLCGEIIFLAPVRVFATETTELLTSSKGSQFAVDWRDALT